MAAPNNRTITLSAAETAALRTRLAAPAHLASDAGRDLVICADMLAVAPHLPPASVDLLIADPPYNLTKQFGQLSFKRCSEDAYEAFVASWLVPLLPALKPTATVYLCGDWQSSAALSRIASRHLVIRNRITWEREKGRGAEHNWKNASEDIWFCTVGSDYYFNVEAVKLKRRAIAPYRQDGQPKDWNEEADGRFRLTHPSNLWTDITVPFWSMPENTEHPTQKSEKFMAKLILASCPPGGLLLDPFAGVGSSAVAARKLGRHFLAIEQDERYACLALKRLDLAAADPTIQGYAGGVFYARNTGKAIGRSPA